MVESSPNHTCTKREGSRNFHCLNLASVGWFPWQQTGVKRLPFPLIFPTLPGQDRVRDGQSLCWHALNGRGADKELKSHAVSVKPAPICHLCGSNSPQACGATRGSSSTDAWNHSCRRAELQTPRRWFRSIKPA